MKAIWIISLLLIISACTNSKVKTENVKKQPVTETEISKRSKIPDFDIEFPESDYKVTETTKVVEEAENTLITNWILQGKDENGPFFYYVAHNELTTQLKDKIENNTVARNMAFEAALKGSADKLGATEYVFKEIQIGNYPGMESVCKVFNGEGMLKSQIFMIDSGFMMVSAGGRKIDTISVNNFLDSFRLK
jgi:hypothetical protein